MKINEVVYPSFLAGENLFAIAMQEEKLYDHVKRILSDGYYKKLELGSVKDEKIRRQFRDMIEELHLEWVQWLTNNINERGLHPATTDSSLRKRTIQELKDLIEEAAQSGVQHVAMISGPDAGEAQREEARKGMEEVMYALSEHITQYTGMCLFLEPLDRGAHKNNLIGPTPEAVQLMEKVNQIHDNCRVGWDSAHVALNKEDFAESVKQCRTCLGQIHLANAIVDPKDPGYGDFHMPMGAPGVLTVETARTILKAAAELQKPVSVAVETRCTDETEMMKRVETNRKFLMEACEE